ncbi:hypothetical protein ACW2Q0_00720 [Nocardia sp. R16R-3T]
MSGDFMELTPELAAEIDSMPCAMYCQEPFPFAWCETHDTTFALGDTCPVQVPEPETSPGDVPGITTPGADGSDPAPGVAPNA